MNEKYLITGSSGFIGKNILSSLKKQGKKIFFTTRKKSNEPNALHIDLREKIIIKNNFDYIIHCAALSPSNKNNSFNNFFDNNILATQNLCNFANKCGVKKVFYLSSISVYGKILNKVIDRNTPINNPDNYGLSKYVSEKILLNENNKFKTLSVRLPGVLGKNSVRNFLTQTLNKLKNNQTINIFNPNSYFNNCIHVNDLNHLIKNFFSNQNHFNNYITIGSKNRVKIIDIIKIMKDSLNSSSKIEIFDSDLNSFTIDNKYAIDYYDYYPSETKELIKKFIMENL